MSQTDFDFPTAGVSGPAFAAKMGEAFEALASSNTGSGFPTVTYPFMPFAGSPGGGNPSLYIRTAADDGWVTLLPNISIAGGGLSITADPVSFADTVEFQGVATFQDDAVFNSAVSFTDPVTATDTLTVTDSPSKDSSGKAANTRYVRSLFGDPDLEFTLPNVTAGVTQTFTHSFGTIPSLVRVVLTVLSANRGFAVGDVIHLSTDSLDFAEGSYGFQTFSNTAETKITIGSSGVEYLRASDGQADATGFNDPLLFEHKLQIWK